MAPPPPVVSRHGLGGIQTRMRQGALANFWKSCLVLCCGCDVALRFWQNEPSSLPPQTSGVTFLTWDRFPRSPSCSEGRPGGGARIPVPEELLRARGEPFLKKYPGIPLWKAGTNPHGVPAEAEGRTWVPSRLWRSRCGRSGRMGCGAHGGALSGVSVPRLAVVPLCAVTGGPLLPSKAPSSLVHEVATEGWVSSQ